MQPESLSRISFAETGAHVPFSMKPTVRERKLRSARQSINSRMQGKISELYVTDASTSLLHMKASATHSALAHQRVVCKPQLPALLELGKAFGAVGVNIGHSGTVCGLLFPEHCSLQWLDDCMGPYAAERLAADYMGAASLSGGGWTIERR